MAFSLSDYSNITELRRGGMGKLYRAVQTSLDRPVVIKEMTPNAEEPDWNRRFENEARAAASLEHDNVIRIYDYGVDKATFYIAMEYVEGHDLDELLHRQDFPREIGLMIVLLALRGLHYSHLHGIVHRDVKPANILVSTTGRVKVADFGLAFAAAQSSRFTRTGAVVGTPHYMAPEQLNLDPRRDSRVDVWAAGVVLYRVITGKLPFEGDTLPTIAYNIVHTKERDLSLYARKLPKKLVHTVEKSLVKDREKRLDSLKPLIDALQELVYSKGIKDPGETIAAAIAKMHPEETNLTTGRMLTKVEQSEEKELNVAAFEANEARRKVWVNIVAVAAVFLVAGVLYLATARFRNSSPPSLIQKQTTAVPAKQGETAQTPVKANDDIGEQKSIESPAKASDIKPVKMPRHVYAVSLHAGAPVVAPKPVVPEKAAAAPAGLQTAPNDTAVSRPHAVTHDTIPGQSKPADVPKSTGTGGLCVMSFPRAEVYLDGKSLGKTPIESPVDVNTGKHTLTISENGYARKEMTVEIKKDMVERIKVKLEKN